MLSILKTELFYASRMLPELKEWKKPIRESLAAAQLDAAWHYFYCDEHRKSWRH